MAPDDPSDKRSAPRQQSADLIVRYSSANVEKFIEEHAHDVSKGGMFVRSNSPLNPGTLVDFEIRLSNDQPVVTGVGRVVWKRDKPQGARPAGMGIKFIDLDEASNEVVDRLLGAIKPGARSEFDMRPAGNLGTNVRTVMGMGSPLAGLQVKPPPAVQHPVPASASVSHPQPPSSPQVEPATAQQASPLASADLSRGRTRMGVAPVKLSPEDAARVASRLGLPAPKQGATLVLGDQSGPQLVSQGVREQAAPQPVKEPPAQWKGPTTAAPVSTGAPESARTGEIDEGWGEPEAQAPPPEPAGARAISEPPHTPRVEVPDVPMRREPAFPAHPEPEPRFEPHLPSLHQSKPPPSEPAPSMRMALAEPSEADVEARPRPRRWPWIVFLLFVVLLGGAAAVYKYRVVLHDRGYIPLLPELPWNIPWLNPAPPPPPVAPPPPALPSASASAEAPASASASASAAPPASAATQLDAGAADAGHAAATKPSAATSGSAAAHPSASAKPRPKPPPKPPPDSDEAAE